VTVNLANPPAEKSAYGFDDPAFLKSLELTRDERVDIACQLKTEILRQYSLLGLKKERLGLDPEGHLNQCVQDEIAASGDSRLDFLDRMRSCVAYFQDTHFNVSTPAPNPFVYVGIQLGLVNGKTVVVSKAAPILQKVEQASKADDIDKSLPLGTEVVAVDGVSTQDLIKTYGTYISSSSDAFRNEMAAESILFRDFLYPKRNYADLTIINQDGQKRTLRLPWWSSSTIRSATDANALLKKLGIPSADGVRWTYDQQKHQWKALTIPFSGFNPADPLWSPNQLTIMKDEAGNEILRMGQILVDSKHSFCYLQPTGFMVQGDITAPDGTKAGFLEQIKPFLASCESKALPLLIDIRANPGGNPELATGLIQLLTPKGKTSSSAVDALRATQHIAWLFSQDDDSSDSGAGFLDEQGVSSELSSQLVDALRRHAEYTNVVVHPDLDPGLPDGFNQKIVALVSPFCISACDIFAGLLKANKLATLVGTSSNGTGAGYFVDDKVPYVFSDTYSILKVSIPDDAFGLAGKTGLPSVLPFDQAKDLITENRPTVADVHYDTTIQDLGSHGEGWLLAGLKELFREN
jgi:hypothetical protein